ncbi:MAG: hypothetical protein IV108_09875 [Burkholderiales bacterium]|nr:hypothetical protein [Burkholderiales bacterium]
MKIARKLVHLEAGALWALKRSTRPLPNVKTAPNQSQRELLISPLVINTLNVWALFVRTYFICCLMGARSGGGVAISSNHSSLRMSVNDAIGHAIAITNPKALPTASGMWDTRDEPTWHDVKTLIRLASAFSFSNSTDIQTAFTFGFTAHRNFVVSRNYYAHRNRGTRMKAQNIATYYGIRTNQHPTDILLDSPLTSPGVTLLDLWIGELNQTIKLLCS